MVYNLADPEAAVAGYVTPDDYEQATIMMQPRRPWKTPAEGLVLYDWYARTAEPLRKRYTFQMKSFGDRLFLVCPVRNGWATVGRGDKFLSPAGVKVLRSSPGELLLLAREAGPITIWQADENAIVHSDDCAVRKLSSNLWEAALPGSGHNPVVLVTTETQSKGRRKH